MDIDNLIWETKYNSHVKKSKLPNYSYKPIKVHDKRGDEDAYDYLYEIHASIDAFVSEGRNLIITSKQVGNGKTMWASKLGTKYIANNCVDTKPELLVCFVKMVQWFEIVKDVAMFKDIEQAKYLKSWEQEMLTCDLLIIDDLGAGAITKTTYAHFLNLIDMRNNYGRSIIYTTNWTDNELFDENNGYGLRIGSRIWNASDVVFFVSTDSRGIYEDGE